MRLPCLKRNHSCRKGCFPRGRLPHPFQVPPALKALRAAGDVTVLQGEPVAFLQSVLHNRPKQWVTRQQLHTWPMLLKSVLLRQKRSMRWRYEQLDLFLSEADWSPMAYARWIMMRGYCRQYNLDYAGLHTGKWTAHVLTSLPCREPNSVLLCCRITALNASGDIKQRWSLGTADAENSLVLAKAFSPGFGAPGCLQLPLQGSPKGIYNYTPSGNCSGRSKLPSALGSCYLQENSLL